MEHPPRRNPDDEPLGPEDEQFDRTEIDMTGVVEQDDAIGDVIYDAIGEAEESDGIVPEWGARTLARALANERDDPISGALHHYAVTGKADREQMLRELAGFTTGPHDEETRAWAGWLEAYVRNLPAEAEQPAPAAPDSDPTHGEATANEEPDPDDEIIFEGSAVAKVNHLLQTMFAEAKARGEVISRDDARIIATMLAPVLGHESAMIRFAEADEFDHAKLQEECAFFKQRVQPASDVGVWIHHFEQYLDTQKSPPSGSDP